MFAPLINLYNAIFAVHKGSESTWYIIGGLIICILIILGLMQLKPKSRKLLIVTITFLAGLFYTAEYFVPTQLVKGKPENAFTPYLDTVNDITQVLQSFAIGLGIYSLAAMHSRNIIRQRKGWGFSAAFFVSMFAMAFIGILAKHPAHKDIAINKALYKILFDGSLVALDATMFSIIAFYITSAAYRAFRIRSAESTLLMATAFIVLLGQVYVGQAMTGWLPTEGLMSNLRVENMSDWILTRVNAPAIRAIGFGLGVGLIATALRIWLSLERGSYFEREV